MTRPDHPDRSDPERGDPEGPGPAETRRAETRPDEPGPDELGPDELDAELAAVDEALTGSLREFLRPPSDIEERVADTVSHRLRGGSSLSGAVDLLGLGARTLMLILSDSPSPADMSRGAEGTSPFGPAPGRPARRVAERRPAT